MRRSPVPEIEEQPNCWPSFCKAFPLFNHQLGSRWSTPVRSEGASEDCSCKTARNRVSAGMARSEGVPSRLRCEFQIANIGPQPQSKTRSDGDQDNIVVRQPIAVGAVCLALSQSFLQRGGPVLCRVSDDGPIRSASTITGGRRPKAFREGTRGMWGVTVPHGLWGFRRGRWGCGR